MAVRGNAPTALARCVFAFLTLTATFNRRCTTTPAAVENRMLGLPARHDYETQAGDYRGYARHGRDRYVVLFFRSDLKWSKIYNFPGFREPHILYHERYDSEHD